MWCRDGLHWGKLSVKDGTRQSVVPVGESTVAQPWMMFHKGYTYKEEKRPLALETLQTGRLGLLEEGGPVPWETVLEAQSSKEKYCPQTSN